LTTAFQRTKNKCAKPIFGKDIGEQEQAEPQWFIFDGTWFVEVFAIWLDHLDGTCML
jgi:hypothetical protein